MSEFCLVTGGAGFIGCALSKGLSERFNRVVVVDKMHPQIHSSSERPADLYEQVEFIHADIKDDGVLEDIFKDQLPNVVIHLAAETGTGQSLTEATRHGSENVVGTTRLLDALAAAEHVPHQILLASSRAVYGEGLWKRHSDGALIDPGQRTREQLASHQWDHEGATHVPFAVESTSPRPTSIYGATKLAQEHLLEAWALAFGADVTILRLQNVYGPGQSLINSYTGIVSLFAQMAKRGESIPLYEDGAMLRDFVFIEDVASAFLAAIDERPKQVSRYDVGLGDAAPLSRVADFMVQRYGAPAHHVNAKYRFGDVRHASCRIDDTIKGLPWSPKWSLEQGLSSLCDWIDARVS
ncbi:MAG: NAD-dependent epimerase/dehydratase family protein [Pseudomonadota bacterium]